MQIFCRRQMQKSEENDSSIASRKRPVSILNMPGHYTDD